LLDKGASELLIGTILLLQVAAAQGQAGSDAPLLAGSTAKSLHEFAQCFLSVQQKQSRPVWFVLHEDGGRISNEGAPGVSSAYRIRYTERGSRNEIRVFLDRPGGQQDPLVQAVRSCW